MKSKVKATWLAFLLGTFGAHHFYMGNKHAGWLSCLFCWSFIPTLIGIVDGINYCRCNERQFNVLYVPEAL